MSVRLVRSAKLFAGAPYTYAAADLFQALADAGARPSDVVKTTVFVASH